MPDFRAVMSLDAADMPVGVPLPWPIFDADGAPLMPAGAVLDEADVAFLLARFVPVRDPGAGEGGATPAAQAGGRSLAPRLVLPRDATIGIRRRSAPTRQLLRFRLIGEHPDGPLFVRPLARTVELVPGEAVEAMAVGRSAVYWFTAGVEAVMSEPATCVILSAPANLKRVRERRDTRVPVRLAARYRTVDGERGLGVVHDVSPSGLSITADRALATTGETLHVELPCLRAGGTGEVREVRQLNVSGAVRQVREQPDAPGWLHHLAFESMGDDDMARLKAALFDWSAPA